MIPRGSTSRMVVGAGTILGAAVIGLLVISAFVVLVVLLNEGAEGMAEALADTILQIMSRPKLGHLLELAALLCIVRRFVADGTGILEVGRAGLVVGDSLGCKRGGGRGRLLEN